MVKLEKTSDNVARYIDQTNPFKRLAGAHRTLKAAYKMKTWKIFTKCKV